MRKIILMLFLSLSGILLYGESSAVLSVSSSGFYLKMEELLFDMRYGKPSFSYKGFSYGDISRRGLFRTLSNPHQSTSLMAETLPFRKYNSTAGSIFTFSDFGIFYVSSPRTSAGFSFGRGNFELAYAYIGKAERKYKLQKDFMNDIDTSLMFGGIKYKHRYFSVIALGSFDSYGSFSGLLGTRVSYNGYSIEARLGNLLPIKNRTSYDRLSINTAIENEDLYISWQCSFGNKPIYSYEYMEKECKKEVTLKLDHINIIAFSSYSFSRKGVARYTSSIKLKNKYFSFGYSTTSGFSSEISYKCFNLTFSKDYMAVRLVLESRKEDYSFAIELSNTKLLELNLTLYL